MKNTLLVIVALLVGGCATTSTKPVKELTLEEKVVGEYEYKREDGHTLKWAFLDNGVRELYFNGKKTGGAKWSIVDGEIHAIYNSRFIRVHRINTDKSITEIAVMRDGKRTDHPKEDQATLKKIK